jgi:hypothetical protein
MHHKISWGEEDPEYAIRKNNGTSGRGLSPAHMYGLA